MIEIECQISNPGHFFACCGLFELTSRLEPSALGSFEGRTFRLTCESTLGAVVGALQAAPVEIATSGTSSDGEEEEEAGKASPLLLGGPFALRLDWWTTRRMRDLKVWAGTMDGPSIFRSMVKAIPPDAPSALLSHRAVVADADDPKKKKEPYYFDARRGEHADPRDIGFSPNAQDTRTAASPAVEALTLIGLQRFRPMPDRVARIYTYSAWHTPLPIFGASAVVSGSLAGVPESRFRFESTFRTSQRKHKAFTMSSPLNGVSR